MIDVSGYDEPSVSVAGLSTRQLPSGVVSTDAIEQLHPYVPVVERRGSGARSRRARNRLALSNQSINGLLRVLTTSASLWITDLVVIVAVITGVDWVGSLVNAGFCNPHLRFSLVSIAISYSLIGYLQGLYPATAISPVLELKQLVISLSLSLFLTYLFVLSLGSVSVGQSISMICGAIAVAGWVPLTRPIFRHLFAKFDWWGERVVVIGVGVQAKAIYDFYQKASHRGLRPVGFVDDFSKPPKGDHRMTSSALGNDFAALYLGPIIKLQRIARRHDCRWGIVAPSGCESMDMLQVVNYCGALPNLIILPSQFSLPSLWTSHRECAGVMGVRVCDHLSSPVSRCMKRVFDVVAGSLGILASMPLFVVAFAWIKIASPGPVFFGHKRIGREERVFKAWKFRTMVANAEQVLEDCLTKDPEMRRQWFEDQKLKDDPRIIPGIGNLLRKSSLDELPQLWNVLKGEMSLVGPRPIVVSEIERYQQMISLYYRVRPGLTGLWQVSGRNNTSYLQRVRLDSYYVCNWSLWLDVYIILRTIRTVLRREGAY